MLRRGFSRTFGACRKVWLLFPAEPNLELYINSIGFANPLARIGSELRGGIIVQTDSHQDLEFPANTLHAVITIEGGFLAGINYSTIECLPTISRILQAQLPILQASPITVCDDFTGYVDAFTATLGLQLSSQLQNTLRSWVELQPGIQAIFDTMPENFRKLELRRFEKQAVKLNNSLQLFEASTHISHTCGCGDYATNIGEHVAGQHALRLK